MNQQFKNSVLLRSLNIQGISLTTSEAPDSPLPIFTVSNRRTITQRNHTILEQGNTDDDFNNITLSTEALPDDHNITVIQFGIVTDFWYGFGKMNLSDTCLIIHPPDEQIEQIRWEDDGTKLTPEIHFTTYKLTKNGKQH